MPGKLYNLICSYVILLLLAQAWAGVASLPTRSRAAKCKFPWTSSSIRSAVQTMGEIYSQQLLKYRRGDIAPIDIFHTKPSNPGLVPRAVPTSQGPVMGSDGDLMAHACSDEYLTRPFRPMLGPVAFPSSQAPVSSVSTSKVATSEQLSPLDTPQATPSSAAAITLTTSNKNAANPINLPGNTAPVPTAGPEQRTASKLAVNSNNVTPIGSSQGSAVPLQSTMHPPGSSKAFPDPTNLAPAPGKTQLTPNSRGTTSPALLAASEDGKLVVMPKTPRTSLSPTSEHAFAILGTDQISMPPTITPTTAPAIVTVFGSAHNAYPTSQRIGYGRTLNSSATARGSAGISSVGFMDNDTSAQKLSTAANITANVTASSRPFLIVSSTSSVANRTTLSVASTVVRQISSKSSASLFPVETTPTSPATISSSSNASGLQFRGVRSRIRDLEVIRLLGCLTACMMIGRRILV